MRITTLIAITVPSPEPPDAAALQVAFLIRRGVPPHRAATLASIAFAAPASWQRRRL